MQHSNILYAIAASIAVVTASPVPQDGPPSGCPKITNTNFTYGTVSMNWGNALPGDVVSYLFKNGGPCFGAVNCVPNQLVMPSTFVTPQGDGTWQPPNPLTLSTPPGTSYIPDDLRSALSLATQQGFANGVTTNAHKYQTGSLGAKSGDVNAGTLNENIQTNYMEVTLLNGDERCAYVTVEATSWSQDKGAACKDSIQLGSSLGAALSVANPLFAIVSGFFGLVGLSCSS